MQVSQAAEPLYVNSSCLSRQRQPSDVELGVPNGLADYSIFGVTWWEERNFWRHQYLVIHAFHVIHETSVFVRVERQKWDWFRLSGNLHQHVVLCDEELPLTTNSTPRARYIVHPDRAVKADHTLRRLGSIIDSINSISPAYKLVSLNCWWFAGLCFQMLVDHSGTAVTVYEHQSLWRRRKLDSLGTERLPWRLYQGNWIWHVLTFVIVLSDLCSVVPILSIFLSPAVLGLVVLTYCTAFTWHTRSTARAHRERHGAKLPKLNIRQEVNSFVSGWFKILYIVFLQSTLFTVMLFIPSSK